MKKDSMALRFIATVTYLLMIAANILANALPLNGVTTAEVSDKYQNLFAPAGITFSIWGVIYILLGAYVCYQLGFFQREKNKKSNEMIQKINPWFITSSVANTIWIFAWHYNFIGFSAALIIIILLCLIRIADIVNARSFSKKENFFIRLPFSIYFGWVTVATIANITVYLVSVGWNGFGLSSVFWMVLILLIGAGIGVSRALKDRNIPYLLVPLWAYVGILIKHLSPDGFAGRYPIVVVTAILCIIFFLIAIGFIWKKESRLNNNNSERG